MNKIHPTLALILAAVLLQACATTPKFDTSNIALDITPQQAAAKADSLQGTRVLWGGVIIASTNLKEATQLEVLAYPLDSNQRPDLDEAPLGRFLARQSGYLETTDYAQGRLISVSGTLQQTRQGRIGESEYTYPVVAIERLHLWSKARGGSPETRFHFGIGVLFSN
ncbi:hypothetical protein Tel_07280 [Candidatus Tenderia electrophaga]|jgi:outer membrane lipoprotein|uniref:Outer membrane lipoprotein Slp n=1 Tax=Candidatus Tenderia electrophaga TaxID=1748243 RepID=A0A0S2TD13_9GAMM|nr:hypothetical protein Tel_07280 [Candidatus Tenderia electrophaga]